MRPMERIEACDFYMSMKQILDHVLAALKLDAFIET